MANHLQPEKTSQVNEGLQTPQMVASAADLTRHILYSNPDRLAHSQAAARHAELLALAVDQESAPLLVAAAWLHDIGYAPALRDTGYHPIDGARYLHSLGWPPAIRNLVAYHSGARFVATVLQLDRQLDPYPFSQDALSDALTVADQTTGPPRRSHDRGRTDERHAQTPWAKLAQRRSASPARTLHPRRRNQSG